MGTFKPIITVEKSCSSWKIHRKYMHTTLDSLASHVHSLPKCIRLHIELIFFAQELSSFEYCSAIDSCTGGYSRIKSSHAASSSHRKPNSRADKLHQTRRACDRSPPLVPSTPLSPPPPHNPTASAPPPPPPPTPTISLRPESPHDPSYYASDDTT